MRCPTCQLTFVHPQPDPSNLVAYYDGMYAELAEAYSEQKMDWARQSVHGYMRALERHRISGSRTLVDLGGGLGYYSKAFQDAGISVTLVEQDPVSARFAARVLGVAVIAEQSVETYLATHQEAHDLAFMRHVIEHSAEPSTLMQNVYACLRPNGALIIETDNNAGVELMFRPTTARFYMGLYRRAYSPASIPALLHRRPFAVDPPRHLYGFRLSNLSMLLERCRLVPVEAICYRTGDAIYWPNLPLPGFHDLTRSLRHLDLVRFLADIVDLALFPARLLLQRLGLAAGLCVYAVKLPRGQPVRGDTP